MRKMESIFKIKITERKKCVQKRIYKKAKKSISQGLLAHIHAHLPMRNIHITQR